MNVFLIVWLALTAVGLGLLIIFRPGRDISWLVIIVSLTAFSAWVSLPNNPGIRIDLDGDGNPLIDKPIAVRQGLDLAGGLKVLLEADLPEGVEPDRTAMNEVRRIVEDRIDSLGALEPVVQLQGERRIIVELPGYEDPERAVDLIRGTALLEFVEMDFPLPAGTRIKTDYLAQRAEAAGLPLPTPTAAPTPEGEGDGAEAPPEPEEPVYHTVMTGDILQSADVSVGQTSEIVVTFALTSEGRREFAAYTSAHTGDILGIVLDGMVISAPTINEPITNGRGMIRGNFDLDSARQLATQLRYGALPIPLRVDSTSTVGPTLGQISVEQSIRAGIIGIAVVLLFMLIYYRLPGVSAALALVIFALLNFAIYKLVPVTLTLPAITGFLISVGTAVDGNILIFERMKEELRAGKDVDLAVRTGFNRAWASIRDSNLSTIIICAVLYAFGTSFGAAAVRGFAVTLALGLAVNLFTAVTVTRTFLHFILELSWGVVEKHAWLLGL